MSLIRAWSFLALPVLVAFAEQLKVFSNFEWVLEGHLVRLCDCGSVTFSFLDFLE